MYYIQIMQNEYEEIQISSHAQKDLLQYRIIFINIYKILMKIEGTFQVFQDTFQSNSRHKMYTIVNIHILDFVPLI
jgi:phosphate starvation-inducible membrane PsiE